MDYCMEALDTYVVNPYVMPALGCTECADAVGTWVSDGHGGHMYELQGSVMRNVLTMWAFLWVGTMIMYFTVCTAQYYFLFVRNGVKNRALWQWEEGQVWAEIKLSLWSTVLMTGMTAPIEVAVLYGYGKVYSNVDQYGQLYMWLSPLLFVLFTDTCIYWIHYALHHRWLYGPLHKLHHTYKDTTPYSAFHFHPIDGFAQGLPYHIFVFLFPFHNVMYAVALALVGLWTINIHDRVSLRLWGVNGAAHHTIHHTKFNYNYGQYFTFWDRLCGTFKDPFACEPYKSGRAVSASGKRPASTAAASSSTTRRSATPRRTSPRLSAQKKQA